MDLCCQPVGIASIGGVTDEVAGIGAGFPRDWQSEEPFFFDGTEHLTLPWEEMFQAGAKVCAPGRRSRLFEVR